MKPGVYGLLFVMVFALGACGGGGSSSSGAGNSSSGGGTILPIVDPANGSTSAPTAAPTATPTATALGMSGTAQEFTSGAALSGFTVTLGAVPNAATCLNGESAGSMPCGVPASPLPTVTTSATGTFTITAPSPGTYMLTIGKDATYATLHRTVTIIAGTPLALGTVKIAALTADEQAWVADVNNQRAIVSVPVSFANLAVDEYAEEQARAEVAAIVSGAQPYGDATEELFSGYYAAEAGSLYAASGVAALIGTESAYLQADSGWMGEKSNCPGGNWESCTFAEDTGHYINISNTQNVWLGVGESAMSYLYGSYGSEWAYAMVIPTNYQPSYPASTKHKF
jgi:hypothetical protein